MAELTEHESWCIVEIASYKKTETAIEVLKQYDNLAKKPYESIRMALINRAAGKRIDPLTGDALEDKTPAKPVIPKPEDYDDEYAKQIPF